MQFSKVDGQTRRSSAIPKPLTLCAASLSGTKRLFDAQTLRKIHCNTIAHDDAVLVELSITLPSSATPRWIDSIQQYMIIPLLRIQLDKQ